MAARRSRRAAGALALVCLTACLAARVQSNPVNIPLNRVPLTLSERAWRALNDHSPTHHLYAHGNLINAQELIEPPYKIYKFTYDLSPICGTESCPREACTIDLKQDEYGDVETLNDSIQCMYFYPADAQNDVSSQEQLGTSYQEQEDPQVTESLAEQVNANHSVELDHEVQETNDDNVRPFIAMRASGNIYCPGCPYELNPQLPGLLPFTEQALRSMDEQIAGDYKHKLVKIVRVTRSVPVSSNVIEYQLLLLVGESECFKNALDQDECPLRASVPTRLCCVTFEQRPWQQASLRITKNNCTNPESTTDSGYPSQTPDLEIQSLVTVKYDESQPSRTEVVDAYEGLKDMLENYTHAPTPTETKSEPEQPTVTEPVVVKVLLNRSRDDEKSAGFSDKLEEFNDFLEDFDLPVKVDDVTADTREGVKEEEFKRKKVSAENFIIEKTTDKDIASRRKRSVQGQAVPGAPRPKPTDDPEIQGYLEKALFKISKESNEPKEPIIVEVVEATTQVVAGTLTKIKVKLGTSDCPKGVKSNCQLQADSEVKDCLITVWSRPWLDNGMPQITVDCSQTQETQRRKRSLRGANYSTKMLQIAEEAKIERLFDDFVITYNRTYSSPKERNLRLRIFSENLNIIKLLRESERGTGQYGINGFTDISREEFRAQYLGLRPDLRLENDIPLRKTEIPDVELPPTFDWRQKGAVTPVKDQGMCGSCWAFSVTGNVEGQYALKYGQLLSLSEQELVDCDDLDEGCNGGLPDNAYRAIEKLGGLELESDYPYEAEDEKCHFKKNMARVKLASAVNVTSNETEMAQWLVKNGPISIGINANAMQFYIGGVSHPLKFLCNPKNLDHGVLIVGYGTSDYPLFHKKLPYWIIKNSWGKRWGEQGYYRVFRGDGTCGLNTMASSAVVA